MAARALVTEATSLDPPLWSHLDASTDSDDVIGQVRPAGGGMVVVR